MAGFQKLQSTNMTCGQDNSVCFVGVQQMFGSAGVSSVFSALWGFISMCVWTFYSWNSSSSTWSVISAQYTVPGVKVCVLANTKYVQKSYLQERLSSQMCSETSLVITRRNLQKKYFTSVKVLIPNCKNTPLKVKLLHLKLYLSKSIIWAIACQKVG